MGGKKFPLKGILFCLGTLFICLSLLWFLFAWIKVDFIINFLFYSVISILAVYYVLFILFCLFLLTIFIGALDPLNLNHWLDFDGLAQLVKKPTRLVGLDQRWDQSKDLPEPSMGRCRAPVYSLA